MAIKRKEKRRLLQTAALLMRANERVFMGFGQNTEEVMIDALSQSQETALLLGTELENVGKADLVPLLEVYCEDLYEMSQNLHSKKQIARLYKKIKKELKLLYERMENDMETDRLCFVFLPYKVSMWDSMETVWKAADKDPDCDAYVVPIPYFDKDQDGNLTVEHYEGDQYPPDVPVTDYRTFRLEDKKPDAVFIHNPYDQNNRLTSVHPDFYSSRLKKYADQLIYLPYYTVAFVGNVELEENSRGSSYLILQPGVLNADYIVTSTEQERELFINILCSGVPKVPEKQWEERVLNLGSSKIERAVLMKRHDELLPEQWRQRLYDTDGRRKPVIFYNLSVGAVLKQPNMLKKIEETLAYFKNRMDLALWLRPHPLYEQNLKVMRPQLFDKYKEMICSYEQESWGILDKGIDLDLAIASCDCSYGDYSSVSQMFWETGKPVLQQNSLVNGEKEKIPCWPGAYWEDDKEVWFVHGKVNRLFHYNKQGRELSCIGKIPGEKTFPIFEEEPLFRSMIRVEDKLYLIPYLARKLAVYHIGEKRFESIPVRDAEHFIEQPLFLKGILSGNFLYCMPAWYHSILCVDVTCGHLDYITVDTNKIRGIPGVFGAAVLKDRSILSPQTHKKRWLILNTDTRKISWCSFEDPESEITSVAVCGETLVFFDAKTGCILKETREAQNTEIKELLCIDSKKVQLYAVSENEVVADDLESGNLFRFRLDGSIVWQKERKADESLLGSTFRSGFWKVTEGNGKYDIRSTEMEDLQWGCPQKKCYMDLLPEDLHYNEQENEVLTLDKWLSLCDRIQMPAPDNRHSGEMIKDYVKSKLANG